MFETTRKGRFIVLEGPDGSGKTTQAMRLVDRLRENKVDAFVTREPGDSSIGDDVRKIVLGLRDNPLDVKTELMLMLADRIQHVKEIIEPMLFNGTTVVCDRFNFSSIVYQGYAGQLGVEFVELLCKWATEGIDPDLYIFTRCSPETSNQRMLDRGAPKDAIESKDEQFQQMLVDGFRMMEQKVPSTKQLIVPQNMSIERAHDLIFDRVSQMYRTRFRR